MKCVIIETVFFVPQAVARTSGVIQSLGDIHCTLDNRLVFDVSLVATELPLRGEVEQLENPRLIF